MIRINFSVKLLWLLTGFFSRVCAVTAVVSPGIYSHFVEERYINDRLLRTHSQVVPGT
jgi:hypothetical protein